MRYDGLEIGKVKLAIRTLKWVAALDLRLRGCGLETSKKVGALSGLILWLLLLKSLI